MPTLSDEEFIAQAPALEKQLEAAMKPASDAPAPAAAAPVETPPAAATTDNIAPSSDNTASDAAAPVDQSAGSQGEPAAKETPAPEGDTKAAAEGAAEGGEAVVEPDYKAVYERLFGKPIRAAGQDIQLHDPEEAISLIQKGVGFHTKMNRLHGDLKYVEMLRNNGLLDEQKLSLLIDAQAGKPGAIKKLLDSAKVDPLSLDSAEASTYAPSDHRVSDEQVQFQSVVSDLSTNDAGKQILSDAQGWDTATKAEIYRTPGVLQLLAEQKELGRYDLIVAEVNRAKLLGQLPPGESFLQTYTRVGQQMMQAGRFGTSPPSTPNPVAQKTVTPPAPANSKKAAAAAPTRVSTPGAKQLPDIKEMDDAAFEAHFRKTLRI
jgi:hypothetical protein